MKKNDWAGILIYRILNFIICKGVPSSSCRSVIVSAGNEKFLIRQQTPISLATTPFSHSMTPILHNTTHILDTSSKPWLFGASWHKSNRCSVTNVVSATYQAGIPANQKIRDISLQISCSLYSNVSLAHQARVSGIWGSQLENSVIVKLYNIRRWDMQRDIMRGVPNWVHMKWRDFRCVFLSRRKRGVWPEEVSRCQQFPGWGGMQPAAGVELSSIIRAVQT